jgi:hypothetical protein
VFARSQRYDENRDGKRSDGRAFGRCSRYTGVLTNADVSLVKAQVAAGSIVSTSNFRNDVNVNGVITNADVSIIKTQVAVGAQLPP